MKLSNSTKTGDWSALSAYLSDIRAIPVLEEAAIAAIANRAASGDVSAQEQLVRHHLRLVVAIAYPYGGYGLPLSDVIAEGNVALIRAAELYDPKFGTKFSTYASMWIKQRIHRAITKLARAVRIPMWRSQRLRKIARLHEETSALLGRAPSESELADRLGLTEEEFSEIQRDRFDVLSLDAPIQHGDEESGDVFSQIADENQKNAADCLGEGELREELFTALHMLDDRELKVISAKFGLNKKGAISFRKIGRHLGMSHEWVRRIAEMAIVKARRAMESAAALTGIERLQRRRNVLKRLEKISAFPAAI